GHFPDPEHGPQQMLSQALVLPAGLRRERGVQHLSRVHRQLHRGGEQLLLAAVEVVDQRRVHPGVGRDPPDRGAVVPQIPKPGARRGRDRLPGAAVPAAAAAAPGPPVAAGPARSIGHDRSFAAPGPPRAAGPARSFGHDGASVLAEESVSSKKRSSRVAGADVTAAGTAPSARRTASGGAPGTRSVRPTSATGSPAASRAPNAAAQDSAFTTLIRASPAISRAVPRATTRPAAMTTSRSHSPASSM